MFHYFGVGFTVQSHDFPAAANTGGPAISHRSVRVAELNGMIAKLWHWMFEMQIDNQPAFFKPQIFHFAADPATHGRIGPVAANNVSSFNGGLAVVCLILCG